jgi:hypothetical protein
MARTSYETRLPALHAHYTALINAAVGAGRMDLVEDLAGAYQDEALELLLASEAEEGSRSDRQVEILELGPGWPSRSATRGSVSARFRRWRARHS